MELKDRNLIGNSCMARPDLRHPVLWFVYRFFHVMLTRKANHTAMPQSGKVFFKDSVTRI
jgi:hypothetical protein